MEQRFDDSARLFFTSNTESHKNKDGKQNMSQSTRNEEEKKMATKNEGQGTGR